MQLHLTEGDLLDQPVEVIVNAWNRKIIPWWLLLPQGVSRAIGLYERFGFQRIPPFGAYREDPLSVFFEKRIA